MSNDNDPGDTASSAVHDGRATFDLRTRPTRASIGMGADGFVSYPRGSGGDPVETTLRLPRGTIRTSFFEIDAGTNYAFAKDTDTGHPPKYFDFYQRAKDVDAVRTLLRRDATALGLTDAEIADVSGEGTSVEQGFVDDWLSSYVQVRAATGGGLTVIYSFAVDAYHNPAVDKILHDGTVDLDVTSRPDREQLGFLDGYDSASVVPEPGHQLSLRLTTRSGVTELPLDSLLSDATGDRPTVTVAGAQFADVATAQRTLATAASALGFDAARAKAFVERPAGEVRYEQLDCTDTDDYTCALRLSTTDATGTTSVGYRLTLTYR